MQLSVSAHVDTFTRDHLPPDEQWPTLEFTIEDVQYPDRLNAARALLDDTIDRLGGERTALLAPDGTRWSYAELQRHANQVAQVLTEDLGVVPGNRVMLRSPNNPWTVAAWLGVLKAGAVVVTTMAALRTEEVMKLADVTVPSVLLTDHRFAAEAHQAAGKLANSFCVVEFGGSGTDDLLARCAAKSGDFDAVPTAADDVALLGPTSGTTGVPKITMHFHRDILANSDTFARHVLEPEPDDVFTCSAPLAFTFGLGCSVVFPLAVGAASLLVERATPVELAALCAEHDVTIMATAPTAYRAIMKENAEGLLSTVRKGISAGEHLPIHTWQEVQRRTGIRLINGIGATEMLHIFISAAGDAIVPGATGVAVPGFRAVVLDADGNEAPRGEVGRLAVIGPVGCRYLADERQRDYVVDGWNVTGDSFLRDDAGYFHYQARSDNMIVSSGYNIGGPEVEAAINEHPDVVECAVVGRPDEDRGAVVCAFVVLREGAAGDATTGKDIQDFVKRQISPYKYPRDVRFVTELPKNPSGKLQHFKLRQKLAQQQQQSQQVPAAGSNEESEGAR